MGNARCAFLTGEEKRVLERHWKGFVRSGAKLQKDRQERLAAINEELAGLGAKFGQNVLADEKSWKLCSPPMTSFPAFPVSA